MFNTLKIKNISKNNKKIIGGDKEPHIGKSKEEMIYNLINSNAYFENCKETPDDFISNKRSINTIIDQSINLNNPNEKYIITNIISNILNKKNISDENYKIMGRIIDETIDNYNNGYNIKFASIIYFIIDTLFLHKIEEKREKLLLLINNPNYKIFEDYITFYEINSTHTTRVKEVKKIKEVEAEKTVVEANAEENAAAEAANAEENAAAEAAKAEENAAAEAAKAEENAAAEAAKAVATEANAAAAEENATEANAAAAKAEANAAAAKAEKEKENAEIAEKEAKAKANAEKEAKAKAETAEKEAKAKVNAEKEAKAKANSEKEEKAAAAAKTKANANAETAEKAKAVEAEKAKAAEAEKAKANSEKEGKVAVTTSTTTAPPATPEKSNKTQKERSNEEKKENKELIKKVDNLGNIDAVIEHIKRRFFYLSEYLKMNKNAKVVIPGSEKGHCLAQCGTPYAKAAWESIKNGKNKYQMLINIITEKIGELERNYNDRINKGRVGDEGPIDKNNIHIWGARSDNWNLAEGKFIMGGGQAAVMGNQRPGVYGIVTMPTKSSDVESILNVQPIKW